MFKAHPQELKVQYKQKQDELKKLFKAPEEAIHEYVKRGTLKVQENLFIYSETECEEENEECICLQAVHQQYMSKQVTFLSHGKSERQDRFPCSVFIILILIILKEEGDSPLYTIYIPNDCKLMFQIF